MPNKVEEGFCCLLEAGYVEGNDCFLLKAKRGGSVVFKNVFASKKDGFHRVYISQTVYTHTNYEITQMYKHFPYTLRLSFEVVWLGVGGRYY